MQPIAEKVTAFVTRVSAEGGDLLLFEHPQPPSGLYARCSARGVRTGQGNLVRIARRQHNPFNPHAAWGPPTFLKGKSPYEAWCRALASLWQITQVSGWAAGDISMA
jgi:hypothetical protein